MNKINPIIRQLVRKHFDCAGCADFNQCRFGNGSPDDYGCADEAADGMQMAFEHLTGLPLDEVVDTILKATKGEPEKK